MELIQRSREALALWKALMPDLKEPEERQFVLWVRRFNDAQIERAFWRTSNKFRDGGTEPETGHRYVTGLLLNIEREAHEGRPQRAADVESSTATMWR